MHCSNYPGAFRFIFYNFLKNETKYNKRPEV